MITLPEALFRAINLMMFQTKLKQFHVFVCKSTCYLELGKSQRVVLLVTSHIKGNELLNELSIASICNHSWYIVLTLISQ